LTPGITYTFKVQSKNSFGTSAYSSTKSVLAAQLPDTPIAPTTSISGSHVLIAWALPFTGGSVITSYTIKIRLVDGISFTTDLANCNGASAAIISTRTCMVPVTTLRNLPFEIPWASSVWATI
jgi:hypothetical protein